MAKASMIHTSEGVAFVIDGVPYDCSTEHQNFDKIMECVKELKWEDIPDLVNIRKSIENYVAQSDGVIEVHDGYITYAGDRVEGNVVDRIFSMMKEGFDAQPLINFLKNVYANPRREAVGELYDFLTNAKLPITEDGCFMAYKRVNQNYTSVHDGKTRNDIGTSPSVPREKCDWNRANECSSGLHFCSFGYLSSFSGSRVLLLKINPADVVAIPRDYNHTKGRAWTYFIEGEVDMEAIRAQRNVLGETKSVIKTSDEVPTAKNNNSATRTEGTPTVLGYDAGYRTKRYKTVEPGNPFIGTDETKQQEWEDAFTLGVEHAKKKTARLYKSPSKAKA